MDKLREFFEQRDESGVSNYEKVQQHQKIIRRLPSTDKGKSFEASEGGFSDGIVTENGKVIGLGIHIYNEDVYPLQSFEIYLRGCELTGCLDLDGQEEISIPPGRSDFHQQNRLTLIELKRPAENGRCLIISRMSQEHVCSSPI